MSLIADEGLPLGRKARHDHRRPAAQVGCVQHRPVQTVHAPDLRALPGKGDIRAEPPELRHLAEAVFKDRLGDDAAAPGPQQRRHQHRLGVGGKAGIGLGAHLAHGLELSPGAEPDAAIFGHYITARLF